MVQSRVVFDNATSIQRSHLFINNTETPIASSELIMLNGSLIYRDDRTYFILTASGDGFIANVYADHIDILPFLSPNRRNGTTYGLLGSNDNDYNTGLMLKDGTALCPDAPASILYGQYADDWRITMNNTLFKYNKNENTSTYINNNFVKEYITAQDFDDEAISSALLIAEAAGYNRSTPIFNDVLLEILTGGVNVSDLARINAFYSDHPSVIRFDSISLSATPSLQPSTPPFTAPVSSNTTMLFMRENEILLGTIAGAVLLCILAWCNRTSISQAVRKQFGCVQTATHDQNFSIDHEVNLSRTKVSSNKSRFSFYKSSKVAATNNDVEYGKFAALN